LLSATATLQGWSGAKGSQGLLLGVSAFVAALGAHPLLTLPAAAQSAENRDPAAYRQKLENNRRELESVREREARLSSGITSAKQEREAINEKLVAAARDIQQSEARLTEVEGRLDELKTQEGYLRGSLERQYGEIAALLATLQRMGRNPPPVMMTHRKDALAMVRSAMLLSSAFPGMKTKADALARKLTDLERVMIAEQAERTRLRQETARLRDERIKLSGLMSDKKRIVNENQSALREVRSEVARLSRDVSDLTELIPKIDEAVRKKTRLAEHNARLAREVETPPSASVAEVPSSSRPRIPPTATPELRAKDTAAQTGAGETRVAVLAPPNSAFSGASAGRIEPAIPFHKAKAQLPLPTRGTKILQFGEKTQYGAKSKGIVFRTRSLAQITSPCDGWVVYAGAFRSYGQLLIINAGGGYHVLLAGLSQIDVQPGQFVLAAEPVGTMGETPSTGATSQRSGGPVLYVEFRKDGRPINPDPWWVTGPEKVQG